MLNLTNLNTPFDGTEFDFARQYRTMHYEANTVLIQVDKALDRWCDGEIDSLTKPSRERVERAYEFKVIDLRDAQPTFSELHSEWEKAMHSKIRCSC